MRVIAQITLCFVVIATMLLTGLCRMGLAADGVVLSDKIGALAENVTLQVSVLEAVHALETVAGAPVKVTLSPNTGLVIFVATEPGHPIPVVGIEAASPDEVAMGFFATYGTAFGISDAHS